MLILSNLDLSPLLRTPVRIFSRPDRALEHLRDHVLTPPESSCWTLVVPAFRNLFDPGQPRDANRLARRLFSTSLPAEAQLLYDGYAGAIRDAARDAVARGWYWQELGVEGTPTWHAVGKSGLYVIWDKYVVRTAFFMMERRKPTKSRERGEPENRGPLPRKRQPGGKKIGVDLGLVPEDTPVARFEIFEKCWDNVRLAYGRACLQQRPIVGAGGMDHWRNRYVPFQEWLAL